MDRGHYVTYEIDRMVNQECTTVEFISGAEQDRGQNGLAS